MLCFSWRGYRCRLIGGQCGAIVLVDEHSVTPVFRCWSGTRAARCGCIGFGRWGGDSWFVDFRVEALGKGVDVKAT